MMSFFFFFFFFLSFVLSFLPLSWTIAYLLPPSLSLPNSCFMLPCTGRIPTAPFIQHLPSPFLFISPHSAPFHTHTERGTSPFPPSPTLSPLPFLPHYGGVSPSPLLPFPPSSISFPLLFSFPLPLPLPLSPSLSLSLFLSPHPNPPHYFLKRVILPW